MLFDNDDDASLNSNSTLPVSGPSSQSTDTPIPTAKFIQGRVGMCKRYGKVIKKRYRYGMLIIKIDDGGSLIFYNNLDTIENGDDSSISIIEDESVLKEYSKEESPFQRRVRNRNKVTIVASMEEFKEKLENEKYLHIPAEVPWKFQAVGSKSFKILVPSVNGKPDNRVILMKHRFMKLLDGTFHANYGEGYDFDFSDDDSNIDTADSYTDKSCQVFEFKCQQGELAFYARTAETLRRNLTKVSGGYGGSILPSRHAKANVRVRTKAGETIAAETSKIYRTSSVRHVQDQDKPTGSHGEMEFRCFPLYCYPNTWFTKTDLSAELPRRSKTFHDLRKGTLDEIGSLNVELIQCSGLPNMDVNGLTDAVCYIVCDNSAFVTDVIPDNCNPCWLPLSRRACTIPIHNAYSQVYIGIFDYDGEKSTDDFIGRVVIDIAQLPDDNLIDVTLPLRDCSRVSNRKKLGSVRLRLQLNWTEEGKRAALLAYLPNSISDITKRTKVHNLNPVTVECPDVKSFQNVVLTVYGKDPGIKYKTTAKDALSREVKLIKKMVIHHMKHTAINVIRWKKPIFSSYVFTGWMYSVVKNTLVYIPAWIVSFVFIAMLNNYVKYHINSTSSKLFGYRSISSMTMLLLGQNETKPQMRRDTSILDSGLIWMFGQSNMSLDSWNTEDNAEYPFSNGDIDPKRTSGKCRVAFFGKSVFMIPDNVSCSYTNPEEAAARTIWESANQERRDSTDIYLDDVSLDSNSEHKQEILDDDSSDHYESDDEEDETEDRTKKMFSGLKHKALPQDKSTAASTTNKRRGGRTSMQQMQNLMHIPQGGRQSIVSVDQNVANKTKSGTSIKQELKQWHHKAQKASLHLFDDRVFIVDEDRTDAKRQLGINTTKNPVSKRTNPLLSLVLRIFDIAVSAFRAVFNVLMWKDPFLSYVTLVIMFCLMIVLLIFPWRKFFFISGLVCLGPQNMKSSTCIIDILQNRKDKKAEKRMSQLTKAKNYHKSTLRNTIPLMLHKRSTVESPSFIQRKSSLSTSPLLIRNNKTHLPDGRKREVIVPSVPFRYNRFYDWPPDPNQVVQQRPQD